MKSTVLLIGPGDFASRIVQGLIHDTRIGRILVVGRDHHRGGSLALFSPWCEVDVHFT